jgi:predicted CoA-binding protein
VKKTAIIGASSNPERYSFLATKMLQEYNHKVVPLGIKKGLCAEVEIITDWPTQIEDLDTVTMYLGPKNQPEHYQYILSLKPKRIIFNPGTENAEFSALAQLKGIETVEACTLVMLRTQQF